MAIITRSQDGAIKLAHSSCDDPQPKTAGVGCAHCHRCGKLVVKPEVCLLHWDLPCPDRDLFQTDTALCLAVAYTDAGMDLGDDLVWEELWAELADSFGPLT